MAALIDNASLEAGIAFAEQIAREGLAKPGASGAAARIALAFARPSMTTIASEFERGTAPGDLLKAFEPNVANMLAGVLSNTNLNLDQVADRLNNFCDRLFAEAHARVRRVHDGDTEGCAAELKVVEGGRA